jgi:hypothetical protein
MAPPLADATNKVKHVAVPSRFAAPSKPSGSGMPCLKTQVEQLKAEALRSAASEAFAIEQRKVVAARASALRLELGRADEDLSTSHCAALEAQCRAAELQRRVNLLEAEGEQWSTSAKQAGSSTFCSCRPCAGGGGEHSCGGCRGCQWSAAFSPTLFRALSFILIL